MTRTHARVVAVIAAACALGLSACGSSKSDNTPTTTPTSAGTTAAAPTSAAAESSAAAAEPTITLAPKGPYAPGTSVTVTAAGFKPNEQIGINECADKGNATGAGDCDLAKIVLLTTDASGGGSGKYVVHKGPFGANNIVCSASVPCLLSVSELVATGGLSAAEGIEFK